MVWTGLLIGAVFGIILQRGRICINSAFRDVLIFKDNYLMKFAALAIALQSITLLLFAQFGVIKLSA
ncbi:YeeE/YedE thiosulfate transporter family protein, partial [Pseudothermotoga sp. U03pept]|uniref:YeeE/YedE thiosulfate transporter family protein n=1 Tax=Pseudothermotoga sp. U03pept TaxID=3447012 RepID=UPI003F0A5160